MENKNGEIIIQQCWINFDISIMGHIFHGLQDIMKYVELSFYKDQSQQKMFARENVPRCRLHVGKMFTPQPASLNTNDDRSFQNYIFRRHPIHRDDMEKLSALPCVYESCRISEHLPISMLPMIYYKGDGDIMTIAGLKEHDIQCPQMIDLGLPSGTKWASCNLGATKPEDYGNFFAWLETVADNDNTDPSDLFYEEDWLDDDTDAEYWIGDLVGTEYDYAHMRWGGGWQMPTALQFRELTAHCHIEWVAYNGVQGFKFTGKNGNSIFFPATKESGTAGDYWTGERDPSDVHRAYTLSFHPYRVECLSQIYRYERMPIRPVLK